jgi:hypothetical protein
VGEERQLLRDPVFEDGEVARGEIRHEGVGRVGDREVEVDDLDAGAERGRPRRRLRGSTFLA